VRSGTTSTDFIALYPEALPADYCATLIERFHGSREVQPGRVGGGVFPELKHSSDLTLSGREAWRDVEARLNEAVFAGMLRYLRSYPYTLIAPLMLQLADARGQPRRIAAEDIADMDDAALGNLLRACFRPGGINLQHYPADQGGYPYWHCELYPKDASCEPLHRHLLWTIYLNDGFDEGETEFLYQQRKIVPRTGALLFAPCAFTHTHRGNRPRGGDKYIATSWVLFNRAEVLFGNAASA